ncbi:uncharacterized protein LOC108319227 [Vigna angularis]|uniref:uncharacterized protein LOC108319227 n=1 Tax=Phaseolus angularis TaxID=3914 RepID=UPI0022B51FF7|nr:uncharacterized protein LOC108319227 [Vigna angularis]
MLKKATLLINNNLMDPSSRNLNWNCSVLTLLSTFLVSKVCLRIQVNKENKEFKMKASLKGDFYKPTFGGFMDLDLTKDKKISLRQAHLFVFNNGTGPITMEKDET